uniref:Uncharacterized protein n=1 Tax=Magnetococcus massalia (strain MO-1) TaxID=451514 RepID=A0A1S7LH67_MAGMO|nr:Protein of unknown function [Candidatus Magnetococcus massalia]
MELRWTKQAHGFHQATFPNQSYQLTANVMQEKVVDGHPIEELTPVGKLIVEESPGRQFKFLFGTDLPFWPEVEGKLAELELTPEQKEKIVAGISEIIPKPEGETVQRFRPRFDV